MNTKFYSQSLLVVALWLTAVAEISVRAGNTWDGGGGDDLFGTANNWNPNGAPSPGAANDLAFAGSTRLTPTNNYTAWDDWRNWLFNSGASSFTVIGQPVDMFGKIENNSANLQTVSINDISFKTASAELDPTAGDLTITCANIYNSGNTIKVYGNNAKTLRISGSIQNSGGLSLEKLNTVILSGSSSYSGDTTIKGGALRFDQGGALTASAIKLGDTTGTQYAIVSILDADGGTTIDRPITVQSGSSGTKTISGANTSGTNTFSGSVTVNTSFQVSSPSSGGTLQLSGAIDTAVAGTTTVTVSGSSSTIFSSLIKNTTGTLKLVTSGSGTLTVSGANNTYSGDTEIGLYSTAASSVLRATATQALGSGTVRVAPQGNASTERLEVSGGISLNNPIILHARSTVSSVAIQSIAGNNTLSGTIFLNSGGTTHLIQSDADTLTLGTAGADAITILTGVTGTRTATLQGAGNGFVAGNITNGPATTAITKAGAGTWTLGGANTYTGATTVNGGTLTIGGAGNLGGGSYAAAITNSGAFNYASSSSQTLSGVISGAGTLTKSGNSTLTLSATNTYSGNTTINAGTLALSGSGSVASTPGIIIAGGATFDVSGLTSPPFALGSGQTITNSGAGTANLMGSLNTGSGAVALSHAPGTPSFSTSGALTLGAGTVFSVNNTGAELGHGSHKLIAKSGAGAVTGTLPAAYTVTGGGAALPNYLWISAGELYLVANNAPVAKAKKYGVAQGEALTILIANGAKSLATDVDTDALAFVSLGDTNGVDYGVAIINPGGASLTYTNTSGAAGSEALFSYIVTDGLGGYATNSITIHIDPATGANLVSATADGTYAHLTYAGIPGVQYALDWATNTTYPINWTQVQVKTAEPHGMLRFTNLLSAYPTNDFFRTRYVPSP